MIAEETGTVLSEEQIKIQCGRIVKEHIVNLVAPIKDQMPSRILIAAFSLENNQPSYEDPRLRLVYFYPELNQLIQVCVEFGKVTRIEQKGIVVQPYQYPVTLCEAEQLGLAEWYEFSTVLSRVLLDIARRVRNEERIPQPRHKLTEHLLV